MEVQRDETPSLGSHSGWRQNWDVSPDLQDPNPTVLLPPTPALLQAPLEGSERPGDG